VLERDLLDGLAVPFRLLLSWPGGSERLQREPGVDLYRGTKVAPRHQGGDARQLRQVLVHLPVRHDQVQADAG
jgi:hypothetical protein